MARRCSVTARIRRLASAMAVILSLGAASLVQAEEAAELSRRLAGARQKLGELRKKEGEVQEVIRELDELVSVESAALHKAEGRISELEKALEITEDDLASTEERIEEHYASLEPRLRARYRLGRMGYLPILLSAESVSEFLALRRMLSHVIESDMETIREIRRLREMLEQQRIQLSKGRAELEDLRKAAASRLAGVKEARREREEILATIKQDRWLQERSVAEARRAHRELQERMARMSRHAAKDDGFASLRGRLSRPVDGTVSTTFSEDGGDSGQKIHRGVDIRAPRGAPVRAVAPGRVVHAAWLQGYGNLVILDHGGGYYTLMAHLDRLEVKEGVEVAEGDQIGGVGDSGSVTGAHLYFEIRRGAEAMDPEEWFR